ncbi:MAG: elongation factor G [Erysipelotrichaceae bacterium]
MKDYLAKNIRNVVVLGHSEAGKSTVLEAMLLETKVIDRMGVASEGSSIIDSDPDEVRKGMSVYTSIVPVEWKGTKINFLDTPGYLDFIAESKAAVAVADNGLIVVDGKDPLSAGVFNAIKELKKRNLPTIFFINKIDEETVSFEKVVSELRSNFGNMAIPFEYPIIENKKVIGSVNILRKKAWYYDDSKEAKAVPEQLVSIIDDYYEQIKEAIAGTDDELMELYFAGESFDDDLLAKGLKLGVRSGDIIPIYCGSALNGTGIIRLLDLISEYFPNYQEHNTINAKDKDNNTIVLKTNEQETLSAFVFKTIVDPFVGKISLLKVRSGILTTDAHLYNANKQESEKINQIYTLQGKNQLAVGKLFTGDIGAVVKLQHTDTNDTLCCREKIVKYDPIVFPNPMLVMALVPKTKNDEDKLSSALHKLEEEDMACRIENNKETHQMLIYTIGDQHLDVLVNKLKNKYKVEVDLNETKIAYRETIRAKATGEGRHKKQSGGAGQFGHVFIDFEPCDSEEMIFEEKIFGGAVPRQFFGAVEVGLRECMSEGLLAGCRVIGVKATLVDGKYHDVDSKEIAFKSAAHLAFKDGYLKAKPVLLEPIVKVEVICPDEYTGTIIGDFNKRRGIILGMDLLANEQYITAEVPQSEMLKYPSELRSMSQGKATYTQIFERYDPVPQQLADKIIAQNKK